MCFKLAQNGAGGKSLSHSWKLNEILFFFCVLVTRAASEKRRGRENHQWTRAYLVKALRESNSEDADEADTDETGGCSAENLFKLVALGRKESGRL